MNFIKNGKSTFSIVTEENNIAAHYAAEELSKYIVKATSVKFDIVAKNDILENNKIYIGSKFNIEELPNVSSLDLNLDGYVIKITDENVYITAQNNRGLIFGVYGFLEKFFGVRFYNSGCELVPNTQDLVLEPCTIIERPAFAMRSYLNGTLYEHGAKDIDLHTKLKLCNEHIKIPEKYGGRCPMDGRKGTHNMHRYVPQEIYGKSHPEFYALNEGLGYTTIDLLSGITDDGKLDESMDISVAKIVIEELKKDIIANPDITYFQFEQEDGLTLFEYPEGSNKEKILKKYGRSGILIRFCNVIARELQEWANKELNGRKIYIVTFAYSYTRIPPVKEVDGKKTPIDETVVATDNLVIRLAMGDNVTYNYFHEKCTEFSEVFEDWTLIANKFMVWAYDMDDVTHLWYYPTIKNVRSNVDGFLKMGAVYLMFEAACSSIHNWQTDLKGYLYANLMWNPNQSVMALYNDYMDNYYGLAAPQIKKIIAILENFFIYMREKWDGYVATCTTSWSYRHPSLVSEKLMDRLIDLYREGENKVLNSDLIDKDVYLKRMAGINLTLLHMKIHKINDELYKYVELSKTTRFRGLTDIEENKMYSIHNASNKCHTVEIPKELVQMVKDLDPNVISDEIDFDNV